MWRRMPNCILKEMRIFWKQKSLSVKAKLGRSEGAVNTNCNTEQILSKASHLFVQSMELSCLIVGLKTVWTKINYQPAVQQKGVSHLISNCMPHSCWFPRGLRVIPMLSLRSTSWFSRICQSCEDPRVLTRTFLIRDQFNLSTKIRDLIFWWGWKWSTVQWAACSMIGLFSQRLAYIVRLLLILDMALRRHVCSGKGLLILATFLSTIHPTFPL